jgi:uncharacterized protein
VIQQPFKFGINCVVTGILLLSYLSTALAKSSFPPKTPLAQSTPAPQPTAQGQRLPLSGQIKVNQQTILLEVARTSEEQSMGLMYRTNLAIDRGMLFVFSPPRPVGFWMKHTLIPLDMVFVSNGVVKHIAQQVPPCKADPCPSYGPEAQIAIDRVIELRSGRAAELRLKVGDRLEIRDYSAKKLK